MTPPTNTLDWLKANNLPTSGKVVLFKAVKKNLHSDYGSKGYGGYAKTKRMTSPYVPGATLTAPDWVDNDKCGKGLHLCATPAAAGGYLYVTARRYMAVEVNAEDIRVVGYRQSSNKIKVRTLKVLHEVDRNAKRIPFRGLDGKTVSNVGCTAVNRANGHTWQIAAEKNGTTALLHPTTSEVKLIATTNLRKSYKVS